MKRTILIFSISTALLLSSCRSGTSQNKTGNDRDAHGCIASAGYRWSSSLKKCIRTWEIGKELVSDEKTVYAVFSPDSSAAEIFIQGGKNIECRRQDDGTWRSDKNEKALISVSGGIFSAQIGDTSYSEPAGEERTENQ